MDISLIEEKMEESIKHIYELNSVVRMSLIEMQFIKKVSGCQSSPSRVKMQHRLTSSPLGTFKCPCANG